MQSIDISQSNRLSNMGLLCAVLIVMLHSGCGGLASIAVPFFFLSSGFFLAGRMGEQGWWRREVVKRIRSLLVPLAIWGGVTLLVELMLQFGIKFVGYDYHGESISLAYRCLRAFGFLFTVNMGPLWFLRMLFILVVLSPVLAGGGGQLLRIGLFAGAYAWFVLSGMEHGSLWNFFEYGFSLRGLLYFSVGVFLRGHPMKIDRAGSLKIAICLVAIILLTFQINVLVTVPVAMCAVYLIMPAKRLPGAEYSFPIYLLHMLVMLVLTAVLAVAGIRSSTCQSMWLVALRICVCLPVSIVIAYAMRRWMPQFAAVAFGGR